MCDYCLDPKHYSNENILEEYDINVYIVDGSLCVWTVDEGVGFKTKINFCPMCGRKL